MKTIRISHNQPVCHDQTLSTSPLLHKFILSSFRQYTLFQSEIKLVETEEAYQLILAHHSSNFRDKLRILYLDLEAFAATVSDRQTIPNRDNLISNVEIDYDNVRKLERYWYLSELVFLSRNELTIEMIRWLKESHLPVFVENIEQVFESAIDDSSSAMNDYWMMIYDLAFEGRIHDIRDLLMKNQRLFSSVSSFNQEQLEHFYQILISHPYVEAIQFDQDNMFNMSEMFSRLMSWKESLSNFIYSPLIQSVPHLQILIEILSGNKSILLQYCSNDYSRYVAALLLYVYAPPLGRRDIIQIIEDAFLLFPLSTNRTKLDDTADEKTARTILISTLRGDIGPMLLTLYRLSCMKLLHLNTCDVSLIIKLSIAHLCGVLRYADGLHDLSNALPDATNAASFGEELLLQALEQLNSLMLPIEVIVGYLECCEFNGAHYLKLLLSQRECRSDSEAMSIAGFLRTYDYHEDAAVVLVSRGMYWWKSFLRGNINYLVKTFMMFYAAEDVSRCCYILDMTMVTCCHFMTMVMGTDDHQIISPYDNTCQSNPIITTMMASTDTDNLIHDLNIASYNNIPQQNVMKAITMTELVKAMLDIIQNHTIQSSYERINLYHYNQASLSVFYSLDIMNRIQIHIENVTSANENVMNVDENHAELLHDFSEFYETLLFSHRELMKLIQSDTFPQRYYLHIFSMMIWMDKKIQLFRSQMFQIMTGLQKTKQLNLNENIVFKQYQNSFCSKNDIQMVLYRYNELEISFSNQELLKPSSATSLKLIKRDLLEIFSHAIIDDNKRTVDEIGTLVHEIQEKTNIMKRERLKLNKKKYQFGYHLLTAT